jgi:hypothetical protein
VTAPTLLIVGGRHEVVLDLNRRAQAVTVLVPGDPKPAGLIASAHAARSVPA